MRLLHAGLLPYGHGGVHGRGEMVKPASGQQTRLFMRPYGMARRRDPHDSGPYRPLTTSTLQNRY